MAIPSDEEKLSITVQVPRAKLEAFHAMLDEFWTGESKWDVMQLARQRKRDDGISSLKRLFEFAETNSCSSSRVIATVLASLYSGYRFRLDLTDLRLLDSQFHADVLNVLFLDHAPQQEVHCYFRNGGPRFEAMFERYGLPDQEKSATHFEAMLNLNDQGLKDGLDAVPAVAAMLRYLLREPTHG